MTAVDPLASTAVARHLARVARRRSGRRDVAVVLAPDGPASTDLDRLVVLPLDVPPGGADHERLACLRGLVEHEALHLLATAAGTWRAEAAALAARAEERRLALARVRRALLAAAPGLRERWDVPAAAQALDEERRALLAAAAHDVLVRDLANVLEDARVERLAPTLAPEGVRWLAALEALAPRRPAAHPLVDAVLAHAAGAPAALAPPLRAAVERACAGSTADAWAAARLLVAAAPPGAPDEDGSTPFALRFAQPVPASGGPLDHDLEPGERAAGEGLPGCAAPPRAAAGDAVADALAEARALLVRLADEARATIRGGRAGMETWQPVAGERLVPTAELRRRLPAVEPPSVAVRAAADAAAEELRQLVARRGETRRRVGSGHLDPGALAGVLTARRTIYARQSREGRRDVAMLLLVDLSESTQPERPAMRDAIHGVRLACLGADVALAVLGFAGTDAVLLLELLGWEDARSGVPGAIDVVLDPGVGGGSTPAVEALARARAALAARPETDRVLAVLTDGAANGGPERLRGAVADARRDGLVVVGLYTGLDPAVAAAMPRAFGDDHAVLRSVRDLGPALAARIAGLLA